MSTSHAPTSSTFTSSNASGGGGGVALNRLGYTPESHAIKPRNINSNEAKQRTMDGTIGVTSQFNYSGMGSDPSLAMSGGGSYLNEGGLEYDINLSMQK
jgi:hypothetical protein